MKKRTTVPVGGIGVGRLALVGVAAMAVACASGGGGVPSVTGAEVEALAALFGGRWELDESSSSSQIRVPRADPETITIVVSSTGRGRVPPDVAAGQRSPAARQAAFEVLRRRPRTLALQVDGAELVYAPTPGQSLAIPINGGSSTQFEGGQLVRTRVLWDGVKLEFEHAVGSDGRVREVLELVDGRLEMTRTIRVSSETVPPLVLVYDRDRGG